MSLLQEIHAANSAMLATMPKADERTIEQFYISTGLDVIDCLYIESNTEALRAYLESGILPIDPRGIDYTETLENGSFADKSARWIKAHYYGKKSIIEIEILGYIAYCNAMKANPKDLSSLNNFISKLKTA